MNLHNTAAAIDFTTASGGVPQPSSKNNTDTYSPHVSDIMAAMDGLRRSVCIKEKMNPNTGGKA